MSDQPPPTPAEIVDPTARKDQIWEKAKQDTEKFITDAAVLLMGGNNAALVADQFAGMAVRSHPAMTASIMATLLVMTAKDRLEAKGLLPDMPPDPFTTDEQPPASDHGRAEAFLNELTGLVMRHNLAVCTTSQQLHPLVTRGALTGSLEYPPIAREVTWSPALSRYVCESVADAETPWQVP